MERYLLVLVLCALLLVCADTNPVPAIRNEYLIKLKQQADINSLQTHITQTLGANILNEYDFSDFRALSIRSGNALSSLVDHPDIELMEPNFPCKAAAMETQVNAPWNLARLSQHKLLSAEYAYDDLAGEGVDIYVLDTGILMNHIEFQGRALFGASFSEDIESGDLNGHGTHVAGIAAGSYLGVAKRATLIDVRVLGANGYGDWAKVLAGLQWVQESVQKRNRTSVINISISGVKSNILNAAIDAMTSGSGIHVVVAAGNSRTNACHESPASARSAVTVGATDASDIVYDFSNYGACVDLFAPGVGVLAAYKGSNFATAFLTGTSMAAPHVAGVHALVLARRNLSPKEMADELTRNATVGAVRKLPGKTPNRLVYMGIQ